MPDKTPRADDDGGWKEAIEIFTDDFFDICFPAVAAIIDWSVAPEFATQELRQIVRGAARGRRVLDILVKLRKKDGSDAYFHIEICGYHQLGLPRRLFLYDNRLGDRYALEIYTLLVLTDNRPNWRPDCYEDGNGFNSVRFTFPLCKLLDFKERWDELERSDNPVAHLIMAQLRALETRGNMTLRMERKWELTQRLYEKGLSEKVFWDLHRLSDWFLPLPKKLELQLRERILSYEQKGVMPYVSSFERFAREEGLEQGRKEGLEKGIQKGIEKGMEQGMEQGIEKGLKRGQVQSLREALIEILSIRFGEVPAEIHHALETVSDSDFLRHLLRHAVLAESLATFQSHL
jgi:hypothetical protein